MVMPITAPGIPYSAISGLTAESTSDWMSLVLSVWAIVTLEKSVAVSSTPLNNGMVASRVCRCIIDLLSKLHV